MVYVVAAMLWFVVFGLLGVYVASQVRRPVAEGLVLGGLFGPIGVLIVALLPKPQPKSPVRRTWIEEQENEDREAAEAAAEKFLRE